MKTFIETSRYPNVLNAFRTIFHQDEPDEMSVITKGHSSAALYQFKIQDKTFVLRLMGLDQPLADREIQVICGEYASDHKVGPHYHYADPVTGIIIMTFIDNKPYEKSDLIKKVPALLHKLHYSGKLVKPYQPIFPYVHELINQVMAYSPPQTIKDYFESITHIIAILEQSPQLAACHNDLNSNNLLFDGQDFYLIDFEAAGEEDPYFDVSYVSQQACLTALEQTAFLKSYLKREPTAAEINKLILMKQVTYAYPALHFLNFAYEQHMLMCDHIPASLEQWIKGKNEGKYDLETPQGFLIYALVLIQASQKEIAQYCNLNDLKHERKSF